MAVSVVMRKSELSAAGFTVSIALLLSFLKPFQKCNLKSSKSRQYQESLQ
jgi:hypothetical protein